MLPAELQSLMGNSDINIEQKIVEELLNQSNLDTKTELNKPMSWACLSLIQDYLKKKKMEKSSYVLEEFIKICFKYLISKDRKGRLEYLEALKGIREKNEIIQPTSMGGLQK